MGLSVAGPGTANPNAGMANEVANIMSGGNATQYSPRGGSGQFSDLAMSNLSRRPSYKAANGTLGVTTTRVGPSMNWNDGNPVENGGGYTVRNGQVIEGTMPENDRGWFLNQPYAGRRPYEGPLPEGQPARRFRY